MTLLCAFADLVQKRQFDLITVADIIRLARVGRSTFYDHFRGKHGILASSIAGPFAILTDCLSPDSDVTTLIQLLEHFWTNRALARSLLLGSARCKTVAVLVSQVEARLKSDAYSMPGRPLLDVRLVAIQIAEVLIAPITAWLLGESRCTAELLARTLPRTARAVLLASYERISETPRRL